jgi:uncharacterized protein (DUF362 family)
MLRSIEPHESQTSHTMRYTINEAMRVNSKVALVGLSGSVPDTLERAFKLVGGIADLNTAERSVVIKVGVYDHKKKNHPTVNVVHAVANAFTKAPRILVVESDNYKGTGSERLKLWKTIFDDRVIPFNLSEDKNTKEFDIAGERIPLSHVLLKPNVLISTHTPRKYFRGSILKNLLGLIPDSKKARFHDKLGRVLIDLHEAVGRIDLAIMDGTYTYPNATSDKGVKSNFLLVSRDAIAVETVGAALVGMNPKKIDSIQEAVGRGLGEGDFDKIEIVGDSFEDMSSVLHHLTKARSKRTRK